MNNLDKQIMAAERELDASAHGGFTPAWAELLQTPADHMHALLVERADALMGWRGVPQRSRTRHLTDAIEAYEGVRWPDGKAPGGGMTEGSRHAEIRFWPWHPIRSFFYCCVGYAQSASEPRTRP
jgi:hypothetical protein